MKDFGKILVYAAAVVLLGCLLTPPLYLAGQYAVTTGWLVSLRKFGFATYFNRAVLVSAALMLWPFLRWVGIRRYADLGLRPNPRRWRDLGIGFAVGAVGLWIVGAVCLAFGAAEFRPRFAVASIGAAFVTAAFVAPIEEVFFRGVLLGILRRTMRWPTAIGFLSFVFASLHFLKPPRRFVVDEITWSSGFDLLPHLFAQFGQPKLLVGGLLTIFLVGIILAYSVVRTNSLFMALGLHAGWVASLRSFAAVTKRTGAAGYWFGRDLITGLAPVLLLLITLVVLVWALGRRDGDTTPEQRGVS